MFYMPFKDGREMVCPMNKNIALEPEKTIKAINLPLKNRKTYYVCTPKSIGSKVEPIPKSLINWILRGVEGCKHLLIRTLRIAQCPVFR